ncbi:MAG TPA: hypothetical protein VFQ44_24725 [Streptosporangiaceae bacterium]|nr:hypothetical protein [Streptosporangiaceae bacterium]
MPGDVPGGAVVVEAFADEVAQVEGGGAGGEPGVVLFGAAVAEFEAAAAAGGDLGDGAFDVGPGFAVVGAVVAAGGPVPAVGAQDLVVGVELDDAAFDLGCGGDALCGEGAGAAGGAEGDAARGGWGG